MSGCPRCRVPLIYGTHAGWTAHGCRSCGGIWLDAPTAHGLLAPLTDLSVCTNPNEVVLACPVCAASMGSRRSAVAGVEVDECPPHGVWFDHDELVRVSSAVSRLRGVATPPGHAAYAHWGPHVAGVGAAAALGAAAMASQQPPPRSNNVAMTAVDGLVDGGELALDGAVAVAEIAGSGVELGGVLEGTGELAGGVLEASGAVLEGVLSIVGAIFEGL